MHLYNIVYLDLKEYVLFYILFNIKNIQLNLDIVLRFFILLFLLLLKNLVIEFFFKILIKIDKFDMKKKDRNKNI